MSNYVCTIWSPTDWKSQKREHTNLRSHNYCTSHAEIKRRVTDKQITAMDVWWTVKACCHRHKQIAPSRKEIIKLNPIGLAIESFLSYSSHAWFRLFRLPIVTAMPSETWMMLLEEYTQMVKPFLYSNLHRLIWLQKGIHLFFFLAINRRRIDLKWKEYHVNNANVDMFYIDTHMYE